MAWLMGARFDKAFADIRGDVQGLIGNIGGVAPTPGHDEL